MIILGQIAAFIVQCGRSVLQGRTLYWAWLGFLAVIITLGIVTYIHQFNVGLISTRMRDQVSWGFYIGNFTFLVGVAAAAVMLVIPAYVYNWKPIKEVVILGEMLAISAIVMAELFVTVDVGRPDRLWHLIPGLGTLNLPTSLLAWDVVALSFYLLLNVAIVTYMLFSLHRGVKPNMAVFVPLVLISIPAAICIHTVTAFLYNGFPAREFWNSAILAPRFLASAFCSGPAVLVVLMQSLRKFTRFDIPNEAIFKIAELMAYAMFVNLFLLGAEVFKEYYSDTEHLNHMLYMFTGLEGSTAIVPWMWISVFCSVAAFAIFLIPGARTNIPTLNIGCVLIFIGVYLEKGMGLVIPGMTPDTLGEIYEYSPSGSELLISLGILGLGSLIMTLLVKISIPIMLDE